LQEAVSFEDEAKGSGKGVMPVTPEECTCRKGILNNLLGKGRIGGCRAEGELHGTLQAFESEENIKVA